MGPPAKRPPVIVIGAHRSGTTATTHALHLMGLQLGQRLDSHHESKALQRLHETYLKRTGGSWHSPEPFFDWVAQEKGAEDCRRYLLDHTQREFDALFGYRRNPRGWWLRTRLKCGCAWGWKEPRATLFALFWLQVFPEAVLIDVIRHPLAVAFSIRERELKFRAKGDAPRPGLDRLDYCVRLALTYVAAGESMAARTPNYRRVRFEDLQSDALSTLEDLAKFCRLQPSPAQMKEAAHSIRPLREPPWSALLPEEKEQLGGDVAAVTRLGYEWPTLGKTAA